MLDNGVLSVPAKLGQAAIITNGESAPDRNVLAEHAEELASDKKRVFLGAEKSTGKHQ